MKCPSCQFEQSQSRLDCECCGLFFAKWKERNAPPLPAEAAPAPADQSAAASGPPADIRPLSPEGQIRFYNRLASMDFQLGPSGERIYFPWGSLGRGFQVLDNTARMELERFESQFACIHCPALVILWMIALLLWLYVPSREYQGIIIFMVYLAAVYGWFGWQLNRRVSHLSL